MIETDAQDQFDALARRLVAKAQRLGKAHAHRVRARRRDAPWRDARVLWPGFGEE